jgi:hypothetical protein
LASRVATSNSHGWELLSFQGQIDRIMQDEYRYVAVNADCGDSLSFLAGWEGRQERYVVEVRRDFRVSMGRAGRSPVLRVKALLRTVSRWQWCTLRWRAGAAGWLRKNFVAIRCCRWDVVDVTTNERIGACNLVSLADQLMGDSATQKSGNTSNKQVHFSQLYQELLRLMWFPDPWRIAYYYFHQWRDDGTWQMLAEGLLACLRHTFSRLRLIWVSGVYWGSHRLAVRVRALAQSPPGGRQEAGGSQGVPASA